MVVWLIFSLSECLINDYDDLLHHTALAFNFSLDAKRQCRCTLDFHFIWFEKCSSKLQYWGATEKTIAYLHYRRTKLIWLKLNWLFFRFTFKKSWKHISRVVSCRYTTRVVVVVGISWLSRGLFFSQTYTRRGCGGTWFQGLFFENVDIDTGNVQHQDIPSTLLYKVTFEPFRVV